MRVPLSVLSVCLLAASLTSQVGPGVVRGPAKNDVVKTGTNNVPGSGIIQVSHFRLPGDPPGTWTTCLTLRSLPSNWGGNGGQDVLIGKYNRLAGTFTPTTEAKTLNSSGNDFGLMLDPTGKYALVDHNDGVYFAQRSGPGVAFGPAKQVQGMGGIITPTYVDPCPVYVGGTTANDLHMLWVNNGAIVLQKLDINVPRVVGNAITVAGSTRSGGVHSPTPFNAPDGTVKALWHADNVGSDSDMMFSDDLDPATAPILIVDSMNWLNNGGIAGGMLTWRDTAVSDAVMDLRAAWMIGDVAKIGTQATIFGAAPKNGVSPLVTALFMAATANQGVALPGINGKFALDLATLVPLPAMIHLGNDEGASLSFLIPNNSAFQNLKLALQGLSISPVQQELTFTNTASLQIQ